MTSPGSRVQGPIGTRTVSGPWTLDVGPARGRRAFLQGLAGLGCAAIAASLLACSTTAPASAPARVSRLGLLIRGGEGGDDSGQGILPYLWEEMAQMGYVEGMNLAVDRRSVLEFADRSQDSLYAAELARLPLDVIIAAGASVTRAAVAATTSIPIVMARGPANPVAEGLVRSIARPGGNMTGIIGFPLDEKRLQLLAEAVPGISRVAVLGAGAPSDLDSATRSLGIELMPLRASDPEGYEAALVSALADGADALLVRSGSGTNPNAGFIGGLSERLHLPAAFPNRNFVVGGGLLSYEASATEGGRLAAYYVDRILRGASPADLPIQLATRFNLVVNMRTARALGLNLRPRSWPRWTR